MRRYLIPPVARAASAVAVPVVASRALVLAAAVVGALTPAIPELHRRSAADALRHLFERWDTLWYLSIATHGYVWNGDALQMQNVVFFPLFPALMRLAGPIFAGQAAFAGAVVSLAAFFGACVQLWRLIVFELGDRLGDARAHRVAGATIVLLCAYPFAMYYAVAYTESLFLLFAVSAFLAMRQGRLAAAAGCGVLAGLTRPNGMMVAIPLAWIALADADRSGRDRVTRLLAALAPALGTALYSAYLQYHVGDALAWYKGQAAWHWIAPEAKANVAAALKTINPADLYVGFAGVCPGLFALLGIVPVTALLGPAYGLFVAVNILPPILTHGFMSAGRFSSVLFPLFIWVGLTVEAHPARLRRLAIAGIAAQLIVAALFFAGWPMV